MFSKVALFFFAALSATSVLAGGIEDSCNTGTIQCCNSLNAPTSAAATDALAGLIGVVIQGLTGQVGLGCNPITVIGTGTGANCQAAPACCDHVVSNSLIGIDCSPIIINA
ncbi:hypothetical protein GALMADRAFT_126674 [Galerina marginata CBS 339.88]|uniref:Hydrophobin n=1 Tax=Galerina marginata (strain CBS 339.88) TaxID=685588 RepID=A0A067SNX6_GALM3|nr:hypothetical protein GALMADRAFT_126674 [Galerina marginata CBS 339.88]